ncbi:MAG: 16S rRNA (guanine(527)-N(7))-methyltransferase RsmG [Syntrophobacteraceae bacterium]|nr:16S rRNA (guanine(527)-N(7))-methyltransferase RsmG [Syntrophobacteraceae bacterium]
MTPPKRHGTGPDAAHLSKLLLASGISLPPGETDRLWKYHLLLRQFNGELNLTRIHNFENMVRKLYVDSILPGRIIELPSPLMDIGSGAGMPGIPLKIAYPELEIILAESRANRNEFLKTALAELGLEKIGVLGRGVNASTDLPVNGIITRALEAIPATLDRICGLLDRGGLAIFMKGPGCEVEIKEALDRFANRYRLTGDHHYRLPGSQDERRLVVFERLDFAPRRRKTQLEEANLVKTIESENNETFRELKKLLTSRGIKKQMQALVFGQKQVSETLAAIPGDCIAWLGKGDKNPPPEDAPPHLLWYRLAPPLFEALDIFGTANPILLVKVENMRKWAPSEGLSQGCTLFIPFQDPENVGAAIRSAVAFGVLDIILLAEAANPFHPRSVRASGGAVFKARLLEGPAIADLPEELPLVPLSREGARISDFKFPASFGLLPGIEGPGLPEKFRKDAISIPISFEVESLNGVVAVAIALFKWVEFSAT